jgi:acetyl esterase
MEKPHAATYENIPYGPHPSQTLDLFRAVTDRPAPFYIFIHGGGFRSGDKNALPGRLRENLLAAGVSVAAINYRLSDVAPFPAAMEDASLAVQFLRHKAGAWGLDKRRVAAGGGSAGAGTSLWIGFRPDQADAGHVDPVRRESTRLSCVACWQAQCSYDAHFIGREVLGLGVPSNHSALDTFFRATPETYDLPEVRAAFRASSAINFLTDQAPPVFAWYRTPNVPVTTDTAENVRIHHPRFGLLLKRRMEALGLECVVRLREEIGGADCPPDEIEERFLTEMADFVIRHLASPNNA